MLAGWRQWADAGSVSSGLPMYLVQKLDARRIGTLRSDGYYLFQIPGTHDLVRPPVKFKDGYPEMLDTPENELFYTGNQARGLVIFMGDEPHLNIERYVQSLLDAAQELGVKRIIGFGGVYGELPYDKERMISGTYSMKRMRADMDRLAVILSDYQGGASIGSYLCRRAGERGVEYAGLYAFVPNYDFSGSEAEGNSIRIETDFMAWLGVMRRVNYYLKLDLDLSDLEEKSEKLVKLMDDKIDEIDRTAPQFGVREYLNRVAEDFSETTFEPLDDIWEDQLRKLLDKFEGDEPQNPD
jgi:proteasome assembly chaperone (PAC2) family protein